VACDGRVGSRPTRGTLFKFNNMITATIGLVPGYRNSSEPNWEIVDMILQKMAEELPFTYSFKRVLYKKEWGCPVGGEWVVEISAMRNTHFEPSQSSWQSVWLDLIKKYSQILQQKTAQMFCHETPHFFYVENSEFDISNAKKPYIFEDWDGIKMERHVMWLDDVEYRSVMTQRGTLNCD